jgi:hypothetical protein
LALAKRVTDLSPTRVWERRARIDQIATAITTRPALTSTNSEISPRVVSSLGEP